MAKTGVFPSEIKEGILILLHKPGKEKGKVENVRPIILLNMIRKILAIIMINRIYDKLDSEIPATQAAYRPGRSTTENVFTMKILAEKALTSSNYEIEIMLLDMSKAFDSVNRTILMEDLKSIVDEDELHILKILIEDVKIRVRNGNETGDEFKTNKGIPQGDCLSPVLFTLYLAKALEKQKADKIKEEMLDHTAYACENVNSENLLPEHLVDHSYDRKTNKELLINQQYADDLSWIGNSSNRLAQVERQVEEKLSVRDLKINKTKTEKLSINKTGNDEWKKCKYLGTFLDTKKDFAHRKQLSMACYIKYKSILESKRLALYVRVRIFNAYIASIFYIIVKHGL